MKKAEISIQFVVLAALALIFLVAVAFVMTDKIGSFSKGVSSCASASGTCVGSESSCTSAGGKVSGLDCEETHEVCCVNACELNSGTCRDRTSGCSSGEEQAWLYGCASAGDICCIGGSE